MRKLGSGAADRRGFWVSRATGALSVPRDARPGPSGRVLAQYDTYQEYAAVPFPARVVDENWRASDWAPLEGRNPIATAGERIENPVTGEQITWLTTAQETDGQLLEIEMTWTRPDYRPPEHVHPVIEETFHVLEGNLIVKDGDVERPAGPGDVVSVKPGTPHTGWMVNGCERAVIKVTFRPPLRWAEATERLFQLAHDGRMTPDGMPDEAGTIELLTEFNQEITPPPMPSEA